VAIVRALQNFHYPESVAVRNRIRNHHRVSSKPFEGDRGKLLQCVIGDDIEAPTDLLDGWLDNGLVEVV